MKSVGYISLALVLLLSTTGLTINIHYCGGNIYDVGILSKAKSCCEESAHHHCKIPGSDANQCSDEHIFIQLDEDYIQTAIHFDFFNYYFDLKATFQDNFETQVENLVVSSNYLQLKRKLPPEKSGKRLSQFQSFLI